VAVHLVAMSVQFLRSGDKVSLPNRATVKIVSDVMIHYGHPLPRFDRSDNRSRRRGDTRRDTRRQPTGSISTSIPLICVKITYPACGAAKTARALATRVRKAEECIAGESSIAREKWGKR
jgi:hypothetical protein